MCEGLVGRLDFLELLAEYGLCYGVFPWIIIPFLCNLPLLAVHVPTDPS